MRNLKLLHTCHVAATPDLEGCTSITINPDTDHVILVTSTEAVVLDPTFSRVLHRKSLLGDEVLPENGSGKVIGVQFLPDQHGACIATNNGHLVLWIPETNELECMGVVEDGLTSMCWSPDQELFILTTGKGVIVIMTREFEPVTEMPLHSEEFGEEKLITVGWGKKETQFHGSEGKQAARQKKENLQAAKVWDDKIPRVSWRGDGQFFAVSSISPSTGARFIRVWSREGVLQSTSEPLNGLEQSLAWKPSGSVIASTQTKPNKHDVVFFEKNGLQHGEFTLNSELTEVKVNELMWNLDSTVLAVWSEDISRPSAESTFLKSYVQLWTCSNYHWSLKQNLTFNPNQGRVTAITWDPDHTTRLHLVTSTGQYLQYTWACVTNHSHGLTSHNPANVFVINGNTVGVTPMRKMVVPPPMSAYQLQLPSTISQVTSPAFPPDVTGDFAVLTDNNELFIFGEGSRSASPGDTSSLDTAGCRGIRAQCPLFVQKATYSLVLPGAISDFPLSITHVCWPQKNILVFSARGLTGPLLFLCHLPEENCTTQKSTLELGSPIPVEDTVISLAADLHGFSVAVQLVTGSVLRLCLDVRSLLPWESKQGHEVQLPHACPQMAVTSFAGEEVVIGLSDTFRFYVNNVEVASNCTSFALHDEFLLLTTLNHTVRCIHRHIPVAELASLSDGKAHPFDESVRRVERGSRIVAVVPEDTKLVLQMPRGNLETIHPRALILASVRRLLDRLGYSQAFEIMKKHRINLNLVHDHNPQAFLQHVSQFIQQIASVSDLNLFLTELQDEDVTKTMYTAAYDSPSTNASSPSTARAICCKPVSKVDVICDAVRTALEKEGGDKYRLCILTTYVKKTSPELQNALELVWSSRGEGKLPGSAEEALKYLLLLVDVSKLYDAALATYNFDLVLMVAEKSQKDPKEYIPFLNQLRTLEDNYCKFTIDKHLKKYSSALHHIALCDAEHFSDCLQLVQEHKLFAEALKLFTPDTQQFKTLSQEYGSYLQEKNRHVEAGIVFVRAELWQLAFDAFVAGLDWRQAFCMAVRLQLDATLLAETGRRLAVRLKDSKRFCEAAVVYEQYAKDIEEAVAALIEGAQWFEALRLMYTYHRMDIVETHLKQAISNACNETKAMLENQQAEMEQYVHRLAIVRQEKERARQMLFEQDHNDNMADLLSDISSVTGVSIQSSKYSLDSNRSTVLSKTAGRSNRNRRKAEHKKWSLKEGSPFEDCALVDAIAKIIHAVDSMREEINSLLQVLVQFHQVTSAEQLQAQYEAFLEEIQRVLPLVWMEATCSPTAALGPALTANAIAQAVQQGQSVDSTGRNDPVLQVPPLLKKNVRWKLHMLQVDEKSALS